MKSGLFKIWDNRFKYYCMTVYSREQAECLVKHFKEMDVATGEYRKGRYRIDEC